MCFSSPKIPDVEQAAPPVEQADAAVIEARDAEQRRRKAAASKTLLTTSDFGTANANTTNTKKTLLGQ